MFYYKFIIKIITVSKNEWKNKQTCCIVFKELLLFPFCFGQFIRGLLVSIETIFWLLISLFANDKFSPNVTVASVSVLMYMYQFKCYIFIILKGQFTVPWAVVRNLSAISLADFLLHVNSFPFLRWLCLRCLHLLQWFHSWSVLLLFCCQVGKSSVWIDGLATGGGWNNNNNNNNNNKLLFCISFYNI